MRIQTQEHIDRRRKALKAYWSRYRDRLKVVALGNTPRSVLCIDIMDRKRPGYDGMARANRGVMSVPRPTTIYKLWIFLHECFHMSGFDPYRQYHYDEYLAEQFARDIIEVAGLRVPLWLELQSRWYINALIKVDEVQGQFIDPAAAEYAGYEPKPYRRLCAEEVEQRFQEKANALASLPRLTKSEIKHITAVRKCYTEVGH